MIRSLMMLNFFDCGKFQCYLEFVFDCDRLKFAGKLPRETIL